MRTEGDVRENPMAGDVWRLMDEVLPGLGASDFIVHARLGGLVGYEAYDGVRWDTLDSWRGYRTSMGRAHHIAQPGGEA